VRIVWVVSQGVKPGGCLETPECNWSSWSHNALRLPGRPVLEPWKGSGTNLRDCGVEKGVHFLGLCRLMGNERL
jgi:hypothetical protein